MSKTTDTIPMSRAYEHILIYAFAIEKGGQKPSLILAAGKDVEHAKRQLVKDNLGANIKYIPSLPIDQSRTLFAQVQNIRKPKILSA